ncbi:hypothetical protein MMC20_007976 [Loxospora ochrophaea]|nr:hypothetical protein [Loxospora ochrophaea]
MKALMCQEIAYFDAFAAGSVTTDTSDNGNLIEDGLSENLGRLIQALSFLSALVIAFTRSRKLTLVTAISVMVLAVGFGTSVALDSKYESKILAIYAKASGLVEESLSSIRNVSALSAEHKFLRKSELPLDGAKRYGFWKRQYNTCSMTSSFSQPVR